MRPAIQVVKMKPAMSKTIDKANCQSGTPDPILPTMATGEVKGIIDNQKLTVPCGSRKMNMKSPK